jgi:hypothetical protein
VIRVELTGAFVSQLPKSLEFLRVAAHERGVLRCVEIDVRSVLRIRRQVRVQALALFVRPLDKSDRDTRCSFEGSQTGPFS